MPVVKRYELDRGDGYQAYATMEERADGDYVKADDFDALRRERDGLREALADAIKLIDDLPWENGNTDPSGSIDEGTVLTGRYVARLRAALKASGGGEVADGR